LLGTLVEVGARGTVMSSEPAVQAAFDAIVAVQARLSRFEPDSIITRFNVAPAGFTVTLDSLTERLLRAARMICDESGELFDISLGSAPHGWMLDGPSMHKLSAHATLDLGGIAKGHAVDCAVEAMQAAGCEDGWVNAGGDIRVFGEAKVPLMLRDEHDGGVRPFASLSDGAFATSHFDASSRSRAAAAKPVRAHASVAAPHCLWADALTKLVAISGNASHRLLERYEAQAWLH
jgi:thiamine biosynthesis lipoprotein